MLVGEGGAAETEPPRQAGACYCVGMLFDSSYAHGWRARSEIQAEALALEVSRAEDGARRAVQELAGRFAPITIWLIGSLAKNTFRPGSDIDFVVRGLPDDQVEETERVASRVSGFRVDVIRLERLTEGWRQHHERFGKRMHG